MNSLFSYSYCIFITLSSIGFGDMYPSSILGKLTVIFFLTCRMSWATRTMAALHEIVKTYQEKWFMRSRFHIMVLYNDKNDLGALTKDLLNEHAGTMKPISLEVLEYEMDTYDLLLMKSSDMIFAIRDNDRTTCEADKKALDIVRSLRGRRCKVPFTVEMNSFECQEFMKMVCGWKHASDVCLSLEFLTAHVLSLGAHSRLAPSFIRTSIMKQLIFGDGKNTKGKYFEELEKEYFKNNRLVLAAVDETNEIRFLPKMMENTWTRVYLNQECCNGTHKSGRHKEFFSFDSRRLQVETSPICSTAFIMGESSDAFKQALFCHNVTEVDDDLDTNVIILNSVYPLEDLEAKEKYEKGENRLVTEFDHAYRQCHRIKMVVFVAHTRWKPS
ncbi:uncharacterized protein [Palaemon carinicauda]|uniref:uncharacterized protein n=1 Tax=Palaemon carinicauda TaxID=392227 RepID=UPI0035B584A3